MTAEDLNAAEWDLWDRYTESIDTLHREVTRMDQTGRYGYVYLAKLIVDGEFNPADSALIFTFVRAIQINVSGRSPEQT